MNTPISDRKQTERFNIQREHVDERFSLFSYLWPFRPVQLCIDLTWATLRLFQPLAPHLIPLAVFSATLPLVLFLSIGSGYLVWKNVAVSWEAEMFLQYGDGGSPYAEVKLPTIAAQQPYDVSLHLVVPATEANFALGNFMSTVTLVTPSNVTIVTARKPAIVLPQSAAWSYLTGRPGTIDLNVPMLSDFVIGTQRAVARVEIGRKDQWKTLGEGQGRELMVLSGAIRGAVQHHGVRGLITRYPLISAFTASSSFFFILFVGLVACLMPAVEWHFPSDPAIDDVLQMEPQDKGGNRRRTRRSEREGESRPKTPAEKRGEGSGSRPRQREGDIKTEEGWDYAASSTPIMSTPGTTAFRENPVRRRSSRHSDDLDQ